MKNQFFQKDILDAGKFDKASIEYILTLTSQMKKMVQEKGGNDLLKGKIMAALFFEPSSRTFGSFVVAMQRLGGGFLPLHDMSSTSVKKGETLPDTIQTFASYTDVIVMRHNEVGSAKIAAEFTEKPIINAGDGIGEHPTQAMQDLFTIKESLGTIDGLNIVMIGDLGHYRPINSLVKALAHFKNITISFVSPPQVKIQESLRLFLKDRGISFAEYETYDKILSNADVLYVTRVKKEYMSDELYNQIQGKYVIDRGTLKYMKQKSIVMHPFPRVGEISVEVDLDKRAVYIREQMKNGMYARMALLASVLLKEVKI